MNNNIAPQRKTIAAANKDRRIERSRLESLVVLAWYRAILTGAALVHMVSKIRFQYGNKKLAADDAIAFVIFSLPAVLSCPGATVECMKNCYARRDERFTSVRASRIINYLLSKRPDFETILENAIRKTIYTKKGTLRKRFVGKEIVFRIHESGDFYSDKYMLAWFHVAALFPEVTFFTYTKSFKIYERCINEKPDNFTVRASIWSDTSIEELLLINKLHMPIYTAATDSEVVKMISDGWKECTCESCTACGCACARKENDRMITRIH